MTKITDNQATILKAFPIQYGDYDTVASDLGSTFTDVDELAAETGIAVKSVRTTLSSMVKRGWVAPGDEDSPGLSLTADGVAVLAEIDPMDAGDEADTPVEELPAEVADPIAGEPADADAAPSAFDNWYSMEGSKCAKLRTIAASWTEGRKAFITAAGVCGVNPHTAATQWQQGRAA